MIKFTDFIQEKHLTPAELKKREEIAKAIEKDQPGMDMSKKMAIATAAAKRVAEDIEDLDEAAISANKGHGFHGEHPEDVADKKFSAMHTHLKKKFGEEGHLRDVKKPNVMIKHFLDSTHGRHIAHEGDAEASSRFKTFKKSYNPDLHESLELDEASSGYDKNSKAHQQAKALTKGFKSSAKAEYHKDGSATIHTSGGHHVSSTTVVDHIHRAAGLDHNRSEEDYKSNSEKDKNGLTHTTKQVDKYSHTIHIKESTLEEAYTPEPGHKIITKKGGQVPGTVEKLEKDYVYFRHPEGKLFRTHKDNVQLDRSVKESEELDDIEEALTYKQVHTSWVVEPKSRKEFNTPFKKDQETEAKAHAEKTGGKLRKVDQRGHIIKANAVHEVKAAEDMAGTSATCAKQKSSDLGKAGKKAPGNKNINLAEALSAEEGPAKGAEFKEMSQEQHLECMKYHKDEYNAIKGKTHKYIKELDETGKTESKLKYHAKMYHKHKEAA